MLVLDRQKSMKLLVLEALLRRLPETEEGYGYYEEIYLQAKKGYEGELKTDREWQELSVPSKYYLLHNLQTENPHGHSHQIDTLFICPQFLWLLEIKNISGRIDFQMERNQFIRTRFDGSLESLRNPIDQAERHIRFLKHILSQLKITLPLIYSIVITDDTTIIGSVPNHIPVFHLSGLQSKLMALYNQYPKKISLQQMKKLTEHLMRMQVKKEWHPKVDSGKLKKGALCERCNYQIRMIYKYGRFICPKCSFSSKDVLIESLHDYALLFKPWITKNEFSNFFGIPLKTSYKLIAKLPLKAVGENRGRIYRIPDDILSYRLN